MVVAVGLSWTVKTLTLVVAVLTYFTRQQFGG